MSWTDNFKKHMKMERAMKKIICDVYDVTGKTAGKLCVFQHDRILDNEMRYYIPDSISFKDDTGIMLASDINGFVCHLFEPEVSDKSLGGTHLEYIVHSDHLFETENDARNVCDTYDVTGLASYDVAFLEKENKWAILYCDLYPNLLKGSSFLHVEFFDKSEGNRIFFCDLHRKMHGTPNGFTDIRQMLEK